MDQPAQLDLELDLAFAISARYEEYRRRFDSITLRARPRFEFRDWKAAQRDVGERIDAYETTVSQAVEEARKIVADRVTDRAVWAGARDLYRRIIAMRPDAEIAATYFNSVTRRVFNTAGVDEGIEFFGTDVERTPSDDTLWIRRLDLPADPSELLRTMLRDRRFQTTWRDRHTDVVAGSRVLARALSHRGIEGGFVEQLVPTFYRGHAAFVIARVVSGDQTMPLVLAIHHERRGLFLGAVLTDPDDVSVLFSYTHSEFMVRVPDPIAMVSFIHSLIPHRRRSELYSVIGLRKHGKTELYRHLIDHIEGTDDRFDYAPGIPGLVMIVFTLENYDVVFKVIRDHFPPQKSVTPRQVRDKYRIVSRHDRAGRLIDAQEFRQMAFPADRFEPELLEELTVKASRSVAVEGDAVRFDRVYVERQVVPLDLFLRQADPERARVAALDYGTAIKNLAATNIFPGDMLIKNFGVTRRGRVVFYDYDELSLLTDCNFRVMPEADDPYAEMSANPWFGVGEGDIFPEEFRTFLGMKGELRAVFEERHGDLFGVEFWKRIQDRINSGETIEIFPYRRGVALHSGGG